MKCKCNTDIFKIEVKADCGDCEYNSAWNHILSEYTYDSELIKKHDFTRIHVSEEGECDFGHAYDNGCHMYTCQGCGYQTNYPTVYSE